MRSEAAVRGTVRAGDSCPWSTSSCRSLGLPSGDGATAPHGSLEASGPRGARGPASPGSVCRINPVLVAEPSPNPRGTGAQRGWPCPPTQPQPADSATSVGRFGDNKSEGTFQTGALPGWGEGRGQQETTAPCPGRLGSQPVQGGERYMRFVSTRICGQLGAGGLQWRNVPLVTETSPSRAHRARRVPRPGARPQSTEAEGGCARAPAVSKAVNGGG